MSNIVSNLGITDKIPFTNIRLNKRGQIQYSVDNGISYHNFETGDREVINLFAGPLDDIDGDGISDDIISVIRQIKADIQDIIENGTGGGTGGGGQGGPVEIDTVVYTVSQEDITDTETAAGSIEGAVFKTGDVLVIKDSYGVSSGYQYYNNTWVAFTGNVSADNVILSSDVLLAGSYSQVGNVTKDVKETKTLSAKGKTLTKFIETVFTKEEQPTKTNPTLTITSSQAGAYEVGSSVTPTYSLSFNEGSYSFDTTTGVEFSNWKVTDTNSDTSESKTGSFDPVLVLDNTNYSMTAQVHHSDGNIAKTNIGNDSDPIIKITANDLTKTSGKITGYRPFFYGISTNLDPLDSDLIRGLTNGGNYNAGKKVTVSVNGAAAKRIIVAVPKSSTRAGLTKVEKVDGLVTDVTSAYPKLSTTIDVDDKRKTGTNLVPYTIWVYQPASIDGGEIHEITLG